MIENQNIRPESVIGPLGEPLTLEEFASWQRAVDRSGMQGLRVTRIQHYRDLYERQHKY